MERRYEQTVGARASGARNALYAGAWIVLAVLVLGMLISAAGILGTDAAGRMSVSWPSLILFALMAAAAAFIGILPVIVLFLFLQKYFIQGMVDSAIK